jgi:hypothetical protein
MTNFIYDGTGFSNQPKTDLVPIGVTDPTKAIQAADWQQLLQACLDVQSFLRGGAKLYKTGDASKHADLKALDGNPNGVLTAEKGSLCTDITNAKLYKNTDGATAWTEVGASTAQSRFDVVVTYAFTGGNFATYSALDLGVALGKNTLVIYTQDGTTQKIQGLTNHGTAMGSGDDGRTITFMSGENAHGLAVSNEDAAATAANRLLVPNGASSIAIAPQASRTFYYDGAALRWRSLDPA